MMIPPPPADPRPPPRAKRTSRPLRTAAAVSVAAHLLALLAFVLLNRNGPPQPDPQAQGSVELLMVEQKGAAPSQAGQQVPPAPPAAKPAEKSEQAAAAPPPPPAPVAAASDDDGEPVLPEQPKPAPIANAQPVRDADKPAEANEAAEAPPPAPPSPKALTFDLEGTDSDTNAMVLSGRILPASRDDRFRNRPPPYPDDAAMRGEYGAVVVVIHVSPAGVAAGADVMQSSGYPSLDNAAVAAVKRWRFHPALKDGQQVPFDMAIRFNFEPY